MTPWARNSDPKADRHRGVTEVFLAFFGGGGVRQKLGGGKNPTPRRNALETSFSPPSLYQIAVFDSSNTLDISLVPTPEYAGVGALLLGTRVECVLTIDIPESVLVPDVNVEIFTEDENNILSVLCPPEVNQGEELI